MSADVDRLLAAFDAGVLLRPGGDTPNTLDLALALAAVCGVDGIAETPGSRTIAEAISSPAAGSAPHGVGEGYPDHVIFVLVDGLGMNAVERLPDGSFLRGHVALEMRALFPTSTAPVLTSLATGLWPAEHGIGGWWSYLPAHGVTATVLPFIERFGKRPLGEFGVSGDDVLRRPTLARRYRRDTLSYFPSYIAESVYTRYSTGGTEARGYAGITSALDAVLAHSALAKAPSFTYLYLPQFDAAEHEHGPYAAKPSRVLRRLDAALARWRERLPPSARVVISADHGQIATPRTCVVELHSDDPLMSMLIAPPDGDGRAPRFHVRPGAQEAFVEQFRARIGGRYVLLTIEEVEYLALFGPRPIAPDVRERFGDLQAIPLDDTLLVYGEGAEPWLPGNHGALSPEEMRIPLIVA
jgi:hypothetical protein